MDNVTYPTILVPTVKAKDSTAVYVENYFDLTGATLTLGDRSSEITATQNNASWRFANSLIAENVELVLDAIPAKKLQNMLKKSLKCGIIINGFLKRPKPIRKRG